MKFITALIICFSCYVEAQQTCPNFNGMWAGNCNGKTSRIFISQKDCDKFIYNEVDTTGSPRYYTLNQGTLYKESSADRTKIDKRYRRAEIDLSGKKLFLTQTHVFYEGSVNIMNSTFIVNTDESLNYEYEEFGMSEESTNIHKCTNLTRFR